jgi:hypothetical protein
VRKENPLVKVAALRSRKKAFSVDLPDQVGVGNVVKGVGETWEVSGDPSNRRKLPILDDPPESAQP